MTDATTADLTTMSDADLAELRRRSKWRAEYGEARAAEAGDPTAARILWAMAASEWATNHACVAEIDRRAGGLGAW